MSIGTYRSPLIRKPFRVSFAVSRGREQFFSGDIHQGDVRVEPLLGRSLRICEDASGVDIKHTMDHDFGKLIQSQYALAAVINSPALLGIRFNDTLSSQKRLVSLLNQVERLLYQAFFHLGGREEATEFQRHISDIIPAF